jgi:hypothetical protein
MPSSAFAQKRTRGYPGLPYNHTWLGVLQMTTIDMRSMDSSKQNPKFWSSLAVGVSTQRLVCTFHGHEKSLADCFIFFCNTFIYTQDLGSFSSGRTPLGLALVYHKNTYRLSDARCLQNKTCWEHTSIFQVFFHVYTLDRNANDSELSPYHNLLFSFS